MAKIDKAKGEVVGTAIIQMEMKTMLININQF